VPGPAGLNWRMKIPKALQSLIDDGTIDEVLRPL
jgi:hypothetical protein